ncbi:tyrosine-type recombinase/integrase [Streptomyces europaeiscabiei]|uniref:tyrosine-type recombinase/integrase n=1 Tax=Streptomyces europaeiscabiei TaxID=146819 RepID=UPI0029A9F91A|nr:site-specific integrase [Streptomyces europaeiscabiei]MDX3839538.1 site-specific integrase [Streptomyces europaeiscabiei]
MGTVHALPARSSVPTLADATAAYLATITDANTRRTYGPVLDRLATHYGAHTALDALADPDRLAAWFTGQWGAAAARTWNTRMNALHSATGYWRQQGWLVDDPTVRLRMRPTPADRDRALSRDQVTALLNDKKAALRDRVLWHMLYETAARAEEALCLDVPHLDLPGRTARTRRKGGARDVLAWQTGTARLLPRLLTGRRAGPVFLTDRAARPSVAVADIDPTTGRARLSYRRAAELFDEHTARVLGEKATLHQLRHSALTHAAEDGASTPMLMALSGHTSVRSLAKYARPSAEALARWQAERDPARR